VPPVALLPLAIIVPPVAIVVPPVALLPLAVVVPPVAIVVPSEALLPLAVVVPPVDVVVMPVAVVIPQHAIWLSRPYSFMKKGALDDVPRRARWGWHTGSSVPVLLLYKSGFEFEKEFHIFRLAFKRVWQAF